MSLFVCLFSLCVSLAVLEFPMWTRLAWHSTEPGLSPSPLSVGIKGVLHHPQLDCLLFNGQQCTFSVFKRFFFFFCSF
ncbi:rCG33738, isoform CRA_a [Rattus norvegicus]|uniref:RCG33738, isoform CRA_a n=1 Tax=Rattus norvegicus TaxID=10116 RepID=A6HEJ1_RAT|nr:rCG33738, isoform CRA_a [Rattus norvegicus]